MAANVINPSDIKVLRELFKRLREIGESPANLERKRAWYAHSEFRNERPMILAETGGVLDEVVPVSGLKCEVEWARVMERGLRDAIFRVEEVKDDFVVEPYLTYNWHVSISNFGAESTREYGDNAGKQGSYHWDPPIKDLDRDFGKLKSRTFSVDREGTRKDRAFIEEHFGDLMPVRMRGGYWWTMGMTIQAIDLIGLENMMLYMYDNPEGLHRLMGFLRDEQLALIDWLEKENLLTLNNENDYIGSGSMGYTRQLPKSDWQAGQPVRAKDQWVLSESQETVGVSPELFEEFVFQYQLPVIERFGLCYYGCCEPVHTRWHVLKKIPNLQRVSVSPWCNEALMAEHLGRKYTYSRKPNPTIISCERFDEELIRQDLRRTLAAAKECSLELVMKDVHTLYGQPERLGRWVELAREACAEML
jgi:hypothetical protein